MSDLVERLRAPSNWLRQVKGEKWKDAMNLYDRAPFEAADRIEKLEAALRSVSVEFDDTYSPASREGRLGRLARAALEERT